MVGVEAVRVVLITTVEIPEGFPGDRDLGGGIFVLHAASRAEHVN